MRYAVYGILGLLLTFAAFVSAGASAQAAPAAVGAGALAQSTLVVKIHDGKHHAARKSCRHHCKTKQRHHRRHTCPHKPRHTCGHKH